MLEKVVVVGDACKSVRPWAKHVSTLCPLCWTQEKKTDRWTDRFKSIRKVMLNWSYNKRSVDFKSFCFLHTSAWAEYTLVSQAMCNIERKIWFVKASYPFHVDPWSVKCSILNNKNKIGTTFAKKKKEEICIYRFWCVNRDSVR